jgi:hypothetical protein
MALTDKSLNFVTNIRFLFRKVISFDESKNFV